jgi:hypothetical protein
MISILHCPYQHHVDLILDFVPQAIHIPGNFFFIPLSLSNSNVQLVEILFLFFDCHILLSQVLQLLEQIDLIIFGHEFSLQLGYHSVLILYLLFFSTCPLILQFIPPKCCMSFKPGDNMSHLKFTFEVFYNHFLHNKFFQRFKYSHDL